MDALTSNFYDRYAADLSAASEARRSALLPYIESALTQGASVLDVGAGSGRDLAAMLELGLNAFGVEPNKAMREKALLTHPSLRGRLCEGMLPELGRPFSERCPNGFDAVVCSAVLMHISPAHLPLALEALVAQLRPSTAQDAENERRPCWSRSRKWTRPNWQRIEIWTADAFTITRWMRFKTCWPCKGCPLCAPAPVMRSWPAPARAGTAWC